MKIIEKLQTIINSNVHQILDPSAVQAAQEAIGEIERLRKELNRTANDRNNQLDRLRAAAGHAERLRARVAELEAERDEQNAVLREATQKLVELNVKNAVLKEKLRTAEDFNENYTVIDDIGPLPKCFHCAHQQSMAFRGPDAPCYQCGIDKGYPKFKADKP